MMDVTSDVLARSTVSISVMSMLMLMKSLNMRKRARDVLHPLK